MSDQDLTAVEAVRRDLKRLPVELAESSIAATMLAMARVLDGERKGSPSEAAKALMDGWARLRELAPPEPQKTKVDELGDRRKRRVARRAGA